MEGEEQGLLKIFIFIFIFIFAITIHNSQRSEIDSSYSYTQFCK